MKETFKNYAVYLKRILKWIYFSLFFVIVGLFDLVLGEFSRHLYFRTARYSFNVNTPYWIFQKYQNLLLVTLVSFFVIGIFLFLTIYYLRKKSAKVWIVSGIPFFVILSFLLFVYMN